MDPAALRWNGGMQAGKMEKTEITHHEFQGHRDAQAAWKQSL